MPASCTAPETPDRTRSAGAFLIRVVAAYAAACFTGALTLILLSMAADGLGDPIPGRGPGGEIGQYLGVWLIETVFTALISAPVGLIALVTTELLCLRNPVIFACAGILATSPGWLRHGRFEWADLAQDLVVLAPAGAAAGLAFWLVRHRRQPA